MNFKFEMNSVAQLLNARSLQEKGKAQQFVDSEVIRLSDPKVPFDTGALKQSAITHTVIGSGIVRYVTPYARRQYFENRGNGQRGKLWFERMKRDNGSTILANLRRLVGIK